MNASNTPRPSIRMSDSSKLPRVVRTPAFTKDMYITRCDGPWVSQSHCATLCLMPEDAVIAMDDSGPLQP